MISPPAFTAGYRPNNLEFHVKARATRIGSRPSGLCREKRDDHRTIQADSEGNFSRVDNRSVSSIRRNALQSCRPTDGSIGTRNPTRTSSSKPDRTAQSRLERADQPVETTSMVLTGAPVPTCAAFRVGVVEKLGGSRNWRLSPSLPSRRRPRALPGRCRDLGRYHNLSPRPSSRLVTLHQHRRERARQPTGIGERQVPTGETEIQPRVVLEFHLTRLRASFQRDTSGAASTLDVRQLYRLLPYRRTRPRRRAESHQTAFRRGDDN